MRLDDAQPNSRASQARSWLKPIERANRLLRNGLYAAFVACMRQIAMTVTMVAAMSTMTPMNMGM